MNTSIIRYILGQVLRLEGLFLFLPCMVSVIYWEASGFAFLSSALLCILLGTLMTVKKPTTHTFYLKEGGITTALICILLSIFGALPFYISSEIPSYRCQYLK